MAIVNLMRAVTECPECSLVGEFSISFAFGSVGHYGYRVGDRLSWSEPPIVGAPGWRRVLVRGDASDCPNCGPKSQLELVFGITIHDDRISEVRPLRGPLPFVDCQEFVRLPG